MCTSSTTDTSLVTLRGSHSADVDSDCTPPQVIHLGHTSDMRNHKTLIRCRTVCNSAQIVAHLAAYGFLRLLLAMKVTYREMFGCAKPLVMLTR